MWYCGWDGGGTKTEVCIIDNTGKILDERTFGPLNPNGADREQVQKTARDAVNMMRLQPGGLKACGGMVIGVAGISNQRTAAMLQDALQAAGWRGKCCMMGDHEIALAGAIEDYGGILIAGTGSVCYGKDKSGNFFRVGGFGYLIDDVGSGYAIGRDILTAIVRAADQREKSTILSHLVAEKIGYAEQDMQALTTWLYRSETGKREIASLASLLPEALDAEDPAGVWITQKAARELADLVCTGWRKTGMTDGELVMTGGILQHIPQIRAQVEEQIHAYYPEISIIDPHGTPSQGAARLAMKRFFEAE